MFGVGEKMKSVIESYIYLLIITLIVLFSIDFVMVNLKVSKVNQVARYVENSIEANKDNSYIKAEEMARANGMNLSYTVVDKTTDYTYVEYVLRYNIVAANFKIKKEKNYIGLARFANIKEESN